MDALVWSFQNRPSAPSARRGPQCGPVRCNPFGDRHRSSLPRLRRSSGPSPPLSVEHTRASVGAFLWCAARGTHATPHPLPQCGLPPTSLMSPICGLDEFNERARASIAKPFCAPFGPVAPLYCWHESCFVQDGTSCAHAYPRACAASDCGAQRKACEVVHSAGAQSEGTYLQKEGGIPW